MEDDVEEMTNLARRGQHGDGEQQGKDDLVALEQAALNVEVNLIGEVVYDVVDSLGGDG